eukprot:442735_1
MFAVMDMVIAILSILFTVVATTNIGFYFYSDNQRTITEQKSDESTHSNANNVTAPSNSTEPPIVAANVKTEPPWITFTGKAKPKPIRYGWIHRVRQVLSADTLRVALLKSRSQDQLLPPQIIEIILDGIIAPHCQRSDPNDCDSPLAFEAREFVRDKILNKNVFYAVWHNIHNKNDKYLGDIYYKNHSETLKSLTVELVAAGYARLKDGKHNLSNIEYHILKQKQASAVNKKLNIHSKRNLKKYVRKIERIKWNQQSTFAMKYKGKILNGIVEQVITGSILRVEVLVNKKKNLYINVVVNIAGINCVKSSNDLGIKAKEWTEDRLLGQNVAVKILFVSNKHIFVQIIHAKGNIATSLLKKGLAEYEEWTAKQCDIQQQKLLLVACNSDTIIHKDIHSVTVIQVISGDTVIIKDCNGKTVRYKLSSIHTPQLGGKTSQNEYLSREAKEFVRQKCIGKKVKLIHDYVFKTKPFGTLYVTNNEGIEENIALELIKKGYAELIFHRKDAKTRSKDYIVLKSEYNKARQKKIGLNAFLKNENNMWIPDLYRREKKAKETMIIDFTDLSNDNNQDLNAFLNQIVNTKIKGVVEYVFEANRLKIYLSSYRVCIPVILSNIRCAAERAKVFLNQMILQRDIILEMTHKRYIYGNVYLNGKNISECLLEKGWATVRTNFRSNNSHIPSVFVLLEEKAKKDKVGIWKHIVEDNEQIMKNDSDIGSVELQPKSNSLHADKMNCEIKIDDQKYEAEEKYDELQENYNISLQHDSRLEHEKIQNKELTIEHNELRQKYEQLLKSENIFKQENKCIIEKLINEQSERKIEYYELEQKYNSVNEKYDLSLQNHKRLKQNSQQLIEKLMSVQKEWKNKCKQLEQKHISLNEKYEELLFEQKSNVLMTNKLTDEHKELEIKYNELEIKYMEQQKRFGFESWNSVDVVNWIVNIDKKRYKKYYSELLTNMENERIDGGCL